MTLTKLHAKIQEEKQKANFVDARRFNSRSREKMEREIRVIRRQAKRNRRKSTATKHLHNGIFSADEVAFAREENKRFLQECLKPKSDDGGGGDTEGTEKVPTPLTALCA